MTIIVDFVDLSLKFQKVFKIRLLAVTRFLKCDFRYFDSLFSASISTRGWEPILFNFCQKSVFLILEGNNKTFARSIGTILELTWA